MKIKKASKKAAKTTRKSTLSKSTLHRIYKPAAMIAWVSIFQAKAKAAKNPTTRKEYLAKAKAQLAKLNKTDRARFRELETERAA